MNKKIDEINFNLKKSIKPTKKKIKKGIQIKSGWRSWMGLEILIMMPRAGAKFQTGEATKTLKQISGWSLRANSNNNRRTILEVQ